ncbi:MAG: hypothetical protein QW692_00530 [Nitrososphaerota archaeon]
MTIYISTRRANITDLLQILFHADEFLRMAGPSAAMRQIWEENEALQYQFGFDNEEIYEVKILGWNIAVKPDHISDDCVYEFKVCRDPNNKLIEHEAYIQAGVGAEAVGVPFFEVWIYYVIREEEDGQVSVKTFLKKRRFELARERQNIINTLKKAIDILERIRALKYEMKAIVKTQEAERLELGEG